MTTRWSAEEESEDLELQTSRLPSTDSDVHTSFFSIGSTSNQASEDCEMKLVFGRDRETRRNWREKNFGEKV